MDGHHELKINRCTAKINQGERDRSESEKRLFIYHRDHQPDQNKLLQYSHMTTHSIHSKNENPKKKKEEKNAKEKT